MMTTLDYLVDVLLFVNDHATGQGSNSKTYRRNLLDYWPFAYANKKDPRLGLRDMVVQSTLYKNTLLSE